MNDGAARESPLWKEVIKVLVLPLLLALFTAPTVLQKLGPDTLKPLGKKTGDTPLVGLFSTPEPDRCFGPGGRGADPSLTSLTFMGQRFYNDIVQCEGGPVRSLATYYFSLDDVPEGAVLTGLKGTFGIDEGTPQSEGKVGWEVLYVGSESEKSLCDVTATWKNTAHCDPGATTIAVDSERPRLKIVQHVISRNASHQLFAGVYKPVLEWEKSRRIFWLALGSAAAVILIGSVILIRRART